MDVCRRTCEVSAACGVLEVNLTMRFPDNYPNNSVPTFVLNRGTSTVDDFTQSRLIKVSVFSCLAFRLCQLHGVLIPTSRAGGFSVAFAKLP